MMPPDHHRHGFSLIDTLLGVGMFAMVSIALIQLLQSTILAAGSLTMELRAQNVAREGMEIIKNIRDSNTASFVAWNTPAASHPRGAAFRELLDLGSFATTGDVCLTVESAPMNTSSMSPWNLTPLPCPGDRDPFPSTTMIREGSPFAGHTTGGEPTGISRYIRLRTLDKHPDFAGVTITGTRGLPMSPYDMVAVDVHTGWQGRGEQRFTLTGVLTSWHQ